MNFTLIRCVYNNGKDYGLKYIYKGRAVSEIGRRQARESLYSKYMQITLNMCI